MCGWRYGTCISNKRSLKKRVIVWPDASPSPTSIQQCGGYTSKVELLSLLKIDFRVRNSALF